tara:strand:- start:879 stop:2132 length:1254 start_codon:yes stop_codon:yes gene_type:complete
MRFEFIANACGVFHGSENTKLLMDPWLDDGVFEGSWCHYPPLKMSHSNFQDVDAIYISHIHPDHFDERYFSYRKDIPIFILKCKYDFLARNLRKFGYTNIFEVEDNTSFQFNEFTITLYQPFVKNLYYDFNAGNLIDSAIVVNDKDQTSAFNPNDNTPDEKACSFLRDKFGVFDLAMINYNAAGPYPSCFSNLSIEEKYQEHNRILNRNINHLIKCCDILEPRAVLPFAGSYVIGGKEYYKNDYLGTCSWDFCANEIRRLSEHNSVTLRENDIFDLQKLKSNRKYLNINLEEQKKYIKDILSNIKYPYESDDYESNDKINEMMKKSIISLKYRSNKYNLHARSNIIVQSNNYQWEINKGDPEFNVRLECTLDQRLLKRILLKESHWNNSEIGCHININRVPNKYEPDAHTLLQFLHL